MFYKEKRKKKRLDEKKRIDLLPINKKIERETFYFCLVVKFNKQPCRRKKNCLIKMTDQSQKPPTRADGEYSYTKLQVQFGGDIQEIVLKTTKDPTCRDLAKILQKAYRIPIENQLIYYRGQRLHHRHQSNYDRALSKYGIYSGGLVKLIGKRGLLD